tara:strand:- start:280 stop:480 length:201 start_codon:yes stop_codon:yes gene_type:complete
MQTFEQTNLVNFIRQTERDIAILESNLSRNTKAILKLRQARKEAVARFGFLQEREKISLDTILAGA